ncbi:MAG: hypothetical protein AMXMBFR84_28790 [Candidatus Hydrogenedentota bacterium]
MSNRTLHTLLGCLAVALLLAATAPAQELEISVSPSPVGSGARAAGMSDAFVAIADDASAASWNPAGLVQLEVPEIAIVGSYNGIYEGFSADFHDEVDSWHNDHAFNLNFLSLTYPLPFTVLNRNVVVGLYYQHKYDFTRNFDLQFNTFSVAPGNAGAAAGTITNNYLNMKFEQNGSISTVSPAIAMELTHRLSLGVALNFWRSTFISDNSWEQDLKTTTFSQSANGVTLNSSTSHDEYKDLTGYNLSIGLLWDMNEQWSFGARYDTGWVGRADFEQRSIRSNYSLTGGGAFFLPSITKEPRDISFPATLAVGAAYRPNDRLTLAMDVSRTDWNDFWFKGRDGNRISLVDASNLDDIWFAQDFDPTYTVRFGAEYVFIPKQPDEVFKRLWSLRGGVFYDQEPATGAPDSFYGFAVGVGCLINESVNIDLAYQLRYGDDVNSDFLRGIRGFDEDVVQNRVMLSTVIYFDRNLWKRNKRAKNDQGPVQEAKK